MGKRRTLHYFMRSTHLYHIISIKSKWGLWMLNLSIPRRMKHWNGLNMLNLHDDVIKWKIFRVTGPFAGNTSVTGEVPAQRPVTWSFDVFFYLRMNKRLGKQSWGWWFETPSRPLWRHCNIFLHDFFSFKLKQERNTFVFVRWTCSCEVSDYFHCISYLIGINWYVPDNKLISKYITIPYIYRLDLLTTKEICHLNLSITTGKGNSFCSCDESYMSRWYVSKPGYTILTHFNWHWQKSSKDVQIFDISQQFPNNDIVFNLLLGLDRTVENITKAPP